MPIVYGAGSWGTALAIQLSRSQPTILWARSVVLADEMQACRQNKKYLSGIIFPNTLKVQSILEPAQDFVVIATPSVVFVEILKMILPFTPPYVPIICASKGIDSETKAFLHVCAKKIAPHNPFGVIAGPSFATEVAKGLPTAVTLASTIPLPDVIAAFHHDFFRVYSSADVIGAEIGGIVKNVIAIAAGASEGIGLGANARAALLTRGMAEMVRFGQAYGAIPQTLMGLMGLGDLLLTASDNQSRNRRFGLYLGQGYTVPEAIEKVGQVVEGARNCKDLLFLAQIKNVKMPIAQAVLDILDEKLTVNEALLQLMKRDQVSEF